MSEKYRQYDYIPGTAGGEKPKRQEMDYYVPADERDKEHPIKVVKGVPYYREDLISQGVYVPPIYAPDTAPPAPKEQPEEMVEEVVEVFTCKVCKFETDSEDAIKAHCVECKPKKKRGRPRKKPVVEAEAE
jgi:hypothetical protein